MSVRIIVGDAREQLKLLPDESVHCVVTSPPYFRQRDYGMPDQIGREETPGELAEALCEIGRDLRRVLRLDGSFWLNIGDTYAAGGNGGGGSLVAKRRQWTGAHERKGWRRQSPGFKEKDITLTPFVVADMLRADGWYLRSTIIWNKQTATEPPRLDRPSVAHEYLFLFTRSEMSKVRNPRRVMVSKHGLEYPSPAQLHGPPSRNMPAELARRCIVSGTQPGDTVLDPFGGSGTTGMVADGLNRNAILIELNPEYAAMARRRIDGDAPLFAGAAE